MVTVIFIPFDTKSWSLAWYGKFRCQAIRYFTGMEQKGFYRLQINFRRSEGISNVSSFILFIWSSQGQTYCMQLIVLSQDVHSSKTGHMERVKLILRVETWETLKNLPGKRYYNNHWNLCVSGLLGCSVDDRCSTTAFCTFVGGNLINWKVI